MKVIERDRDQLIVRYQRSVWQGLAIGVIFGCSGVCGIGGIISPDRSWRSLVSTCGHRELLGVCGGDIKRKISNSCDV